MMLRKGALRFLPILHLILSSDLSKALTGLQKRDDPNHSSNEAHSALPRERLGANIRKQNERVNT